MTANNQTTSTNAQPTALPGRGLVVALSAWGLWYAAYRAYYAVGGTVGMTGTPVSPSQFRMVNAVGAAVILAAAVLPWMILRWAWLRRLTPVIGWVAAVGCCMHALVD